MMSGRRCLWWRRLGRFMFKSARGLGRVLVETAHLYLEARCFDHAASISFFTLLSVVPLVILIASAAGYAVNLLGPSSDLLDALIERLTQVAQQLAPVESSTVREIVVGLARRRGQFGLVGAFVMLLGASMVFGALEHAMVDVFRLRKGRRFIVSRLVFGVFLISVVILLFGAYQATLLINRLMGFLGLDRLETMTRVAPLIHDLMARTPIPLFFLGILYGVGLVRPRPRNAVFGTLLFSLAWFTVSGGFSWYVTNVTRYGVLYGSLATPIVLAIWLFYGVNILLFCLAFVSVLEDAKASRVGRKASRSK